MPDPPPQDADQMLAQAHLCLVRKDYGGARRLAEQVLALRPNDPDAPAILREARLRGRGPSSGTSSSAIGAIRCICALAGVACAFGAYMLFSSAGHGSPMEGAGPVVHGLHRAEWKLLGCVGLGVLALLAFAGAGLLDSDWRSLDRPDDPDAARRTLRWLRWW